MHVLDACAAPGGKSFAAAIAMKNEGRIDSCDLHEKKIRLIKDGAQRLGIDIINAFPHDARAPQGKLYDAIIADVPCSGLGVIRKSRRYAAKHSLTAPPCRPFRRQYSKAFHTISSRTEF